MKLPVMWHAQETSRGWFDSTAMLNDALDLYDCEHYGCWEGMPEVDGGMVIVHGGREIGREDKLNEDIRHLKWVILVFLGDEESSFRTDKIEHPNKIVWVQEPLPARHSEADRFMICGYAFRMQQYVAITPRDLDWFFGGQVQNERRKACVDALRTLDWGGIVIETKGFYQGISQAEYYRTVSRASLIPCPSGSFSQDAARPWSALECGSIPILDDLSPRRSEPGFWEMVLGQHPLPVITDWSTLPSVIDSLKKKNIGLLAAECQDWWIKYKRDFNNWIGEDVETFGEHCERIRS